jgi:hypothetical protein
VVGFAEGRPIDRFGLRDDQWERIKWRDTDEFVWTARSGQQLIEPMQFSWPSSCGCGANGVLAVALRIKR